MGIELPYNKIAIELLNKDNNTVISNTINDNNTATSSNVIQNDENNNRKRKFTKFFDDKSENMMLSDQINSEEVIQSTDRNQFDAIIQTEQNN